MSKLSIVRISDFYCTFTIIQTLTQSSVVDRFASTSIYWQEEEALLYIRLCIQSANLEKEEKKPHESMNPYSPNNNGEPQTGWFQSLIPEKNSWPGKKRAKWIC